MTVRTLKESIERLRAIIGREHHATESKRVVTKKVVLSEAERTQALLMRLEQTYDPPGHLRPEGPRHDNDFANIAQIRICPASDKLMCPISPYLPVIVPGAPDHLPGGSMERHLDAYARISRKIFSFPWECSLNNTQVPHLRIPERIAGRLGHHVKPAIREQTRADRVGETGGKGRRTLQIFW